MQQILAEVRRRVETEEAKPLIVSVLGQTGVGKSSLINALFGTDLRTDPVRPCTKQPERVVTRGNAGHELWFYDMPGIGESKGADSGYLADYQEILQFSDVVLWAIHADSRSVSQDLHAIEQLTSRLSSAGCAELLTRTTFILTKADLLAPSPWCFVKSHENGSFVATQETSKLLLDKEKYFQEIFLLPYASELSSSTYHDGTPFTSPDPRFLINKHEIKFNGFLDETTAKQLKELYHRDSGVIHRLCDNHRVISVSSRLRYNLYQLVVVIINKLGQSAVDRFANFLSSNNNVLNELPLAKALSFSNIIIVDRDQKKLVFDLKKIPLP